MLGLALAAAVLAITGWLAMLACVVLALVQNDIVGWGWALAIAALLSFAGAGGLVSHGDPAQQASAVPGHAAATEANVRRGESR